MKTHSTNHLVKSEDLNHHGTLYAGRCAEWTVEAGFIAVAHELNPRHIVCMKVHGFEFLRPVRAGHIINFRSQIVRTGRSTITVFVEVVDVRDNGTITSDAFITFCYVDENTKSIPHGIVCTPQTEREVELHRVATELMTRKK